MNGVGRCLTVSECGIGYFGSKTLRSCISKDVCNSSPNNGYIYNEFCVVDCSETDQPYHSEGRCLTTCEDGFFGYEGAGECLGTCPVTFYAYATQRVCISQ